MYTVLLLTGSAGSVMSLANVAAIGAMALINITAIVALGRHDQHHDQRVDQPGLRLPLGRALPTLGLITALSQLAFIDLAQVALGAVLLAAGAIVYLLRHRLHHAGHHSILTGHVARGNTPIARAIAGRERVATVQLPD